jgi:hypothetical protein
VFEVLDGLWYQIYDKFMVKDPSTEFCVSINLYVDRSETVTFQHYSFEPLIMICLLLNNKTRNRKTSSRVLALLPNLEGKSSAVKTSTRTKQSNKGIHNYHKCLSVALESFKKVQCEGGMRMFLPLGDDVRIRLLRVPLAFVVRDVKSQDTITGRYGGNNCARMCRACNDSFIELDDPEHKCVALR